MHLCNMFRVLALIFHIEFACDIQHTVLLTQSARIPCTQRIALQICTAVSNSNLQILYGLMAAAATCCYSHDPNSLRCQQIDPPPWRRFFLCFGALLLIWILVAQFAIIGPARWTCACGRRLIHRFAECNVCTCGCNDNGRVNIFTLQMGFSHTFN